MTDRPRRSVRLLLGPLLLLGLLSLIAAVPIDADEAAGERKFAQGLDRIRRLAGQGKGKAGSEHLDKLLVEYERKPYAYARRAELEDLSRRLAFLAQAKPVKPKDVVSGDLVKWNASSGAIKIVYTSETAGDLRREDESKVIWRGARKGWVHPARFVGPVDVRLEGQFNLSKMARDRWTPFVSYGEWKLTRDKPTMYWGYFSYFSVRDGPQGMWGSLTAEAPGGPTSGTWDSELITLGKPNRSYTFVFRVSRSRISAAIGGKKVSEKRADNGLAGPLAFQGVGWKKVTITGSIEPSWIQEKVDKAVQKQLKTFRRTYRVSQHLPAWLFQATGASQQDSIGEATKPLPAFPEAPDPEYAAALEKIRRDLQAREFESALRTILALQRDDAPASLTAWLRARTLEASGDLTIGLEQVNRCLALHPKFTPAHLLRGTYLRRLARLDEAFAAYETAVGLAATHPAPYEAGMWSMLIAGRPADARTLGEAAARRGVKSKRLTLLGAALAKAQNGPTWSRTYEHKSSSFHVMSDVNKEICREAARMLEDAFSAYRVTIGWVSRSTSNRFKVYLFSGQAGFLQYQRDLGVLMGTPHERAAGLYSPLLKQLLIWSLPRHQEMLATIRHEGFHQFLDVLAPDAPTWFNEGLAVYHENGKKAAGRMEFGSSHPTYARLLRAQGLVPLERFVSAPRAAFYEGGHRSYAQAWALIHMLRHGEKRHRTLFDELVKALQAEAGTEAAAALLSPATLAQLDTDLKLYVADLR